MEMQKPYDVSALAQELKKQGIVEGEKVAKAFVVVLCDWMSSSMKLSTEGLLGKLDDLAIPAVGWFQNFALSKLDGIESALSPAPSAPVAAEPVPAPASSVPPSAGGA